MSPTPHLALARKWRPQRFEDVIGQRGVVDTLKNAISTGRLAQSFIFAGPRGVGKTTTARILARALNCVKGPTPEPCGKCDACVEIAEGRDVDVLEIDGATYTGVDAVREVIVEPLSIAPMRDRFKIFIIDEVHRLSKSAFDALLKSIEEPPPYVKFMMATTELHAVPATIQSRSQVFELKALPFSAIRDQLKTVTSREKVKIDDGALALVARSAEGSMRDALSALDQVLAFTSDRVTLEDVSTVLGLIGRDLQFEIAETVAREDAAAVVRARRPGRRSRLRPAHRLPRARAAGARSARDSRSTRHASAIRRSPPKASAIASRRSPARYSREDLLRAFDLLVARGVRDPQLVAAAPSLRDGAGEVDPSPEAHAARGSDRVAAKRRQRAAHAGARSTGAASSAPRRRFRATGAASRHRRKHQSRARDPGPRNPDSRNPREPQGTPRNLREPQGTPGDLRRRSEVLAAFLRSANRTRRSSAWSSPRRRASTVEGDTVVFTFAPLHKALRAQLEGKRGWIEQLAQAVAGRKIAVVAREGQPAAARPAGERSSRRPRAKAGLRDGAKGGADGSGRARRVRW